MGCTSGIDVPLPTAAGSPLPTSAVLGGASGSFEKRTTLLKTPRTLIELPPPTTAARPRAVQSSTVFPFLATMAGLLPEERWVGIDLSGDRSTTVFQTGE